MMMRVSFRRRLTAALPILLAAALAAPSASAARRDPLPPVYRSPETVREAQAILTEMDLLEPGAYSPGRVDHATARALRAFQREHFIRASGALDFETYALLTSHGRHAHGSAASGRAAAGSAPRPSPGEPVRVARADAAEPPAGPAPVEREMPETAGAIPAIALLGALLLSGGAALLRRRRP